MMMCIFLFLFLIGAQGAQNGWVSIRPKINTDYCFDIRGTNLNAGAVVQVVSGCTEASNEIFYFYTDNTIRPAGNTNLCFNAQGGSLSSGDIIKLQTCSGSITQSFTKNTDGTIRPGTKQAMCFNINGGITSGANLQLYTCSAGDNEVFILRPISPGTIQLYAGPYCLAPSSPILTAGMGMILDNCNSTNPNQIFYFTPVDWTIRLAANPAWCLNVDHSSFTSGTYVLLYTCSGAVNEQFFMNVDGTIRVWSQRTYNLNIAGGIGVGWSVILFPGTGATNERFFVNSAIACGQSLQAYTVTNAAHALFDFNLPTNYPLVSLQTCSPITTFDTELTIYNSSTWTINNDDNEGDLCDENQYTSWIRIPDLRTGLYTIDQTGWNSNTGTFLLTVNCFGPTQICTYTSTDNVTSNCSTPMGNKEICTEDCAYGYNKQSGNGKRVCSGTTLLSSTLVCTPVACAALTSAPFANSVVGTCGNITYYGQTCSVQCKTGFSAANGNLVTTCQASGSLSPTPTGPCNDINECATNNGNCGSGFTCNNTIGSYQCIDIDECKANSTICPTYSNCINLNGSYTCNCTTGSQLIGGICADIDECASNSFICPGGGYCVNTINSYFCGPYILNNTLSPNTSPTTMGGMNLTFNVMHNNSNYTIPDIYYGINTSDLHYFKCKQTFLGTLLANNTRKMTCTVNAGIGSNLVFSLYTCVQTNCGYSKPGSDKFSYQLPTILPNTLRFTSTNSSGTNKLNTLDTLGDRISFNGTNFFYDVNLLQVFFGPSTKKRQYTCELVSSTSYQTITCNTQAYASGANNFTVVVGTYEITGTDQLIYPTLPLVDSVQGCNNTGVMTEQCPTQGLSTLTIRGGTFVAPIVVFVGGSPCNVLEANETVILCSLPIGTGFNRSVLVSSYAGYSPAVNYVSYAIPVITDISGCTGTGTSTIDCPRNGNIPITLLGRYFGVSGATVLIGSYECIGVIHDSSTPHNKLTCFIPPGTEVDRSVLLIQGGGQASRNSLISLSYEECPFGTFQQSINCTNCSLGWYSDSKNSLACLPCPLATYASINGSISCVPCPSGTFETATGASICQDCKEGTYTDASGSQYCKSCPPGTFTNDTATTSCTPCLSGYYQPKEDSIACIACSPGTYTLTTGQLYCVLCEEGKFAKQNASVTCLPCGPGLYQPKIGNETCIPCPQSYFTAISGSAACTVCPGGYFTKNTGQTTCALCEAGYTSDSGDLACQPAPIGSYVSTSGQKFSQECAAGTFTNTTASTTCLSCDLGYFQNSTGMSYCMDCPVGRHSETPGQLFCTVCAPGTFSDTNQTISCTSCSAGFYQPKEASTSCLPCPLGSYTLTSGQLFCVLCEEGKFANTTNLTTCYPCTVGTYQSKVGNSSCDNCPQSQFTAITGSAACTLCPGGSYTNATGQTTCELCLAGYTSDSGDLVCKPAPIGSYVSTSGQKFSQECPPGSFTNVTATVLCKPCPLGYFQNTGGASSCVDCPVGKYTESTGQLFCLVCPPGTFSNTTHTSSCTSCSPGYYSQDSQTHCLPCTPGTTSTPGASQCTNCLPNFIAPYSASPICSPCLNIQETDDNRTRCLCPKGTYGEDETGLHCQPCPIGAICDRVGLVVETLGTSKGYWRSSNTSLIFQSCLNIENCPGQPSSGSSALESGSNSSAGSGALGTAPSSSQCSAYRTGPLCALCEKGTAQRFGTKDCSPCKSSTENAGLIILSIVCIIIGLSFLYYSALRIGNLQKSMIEKEKRKNLSGSSRSHLSTDPQLETYSSMSTLGAMVRGSSPSWYEMPEMMPTTTGEPAEVVVGGIVYHELYPEVRKEPTFTFNLKSTLSFFQIVTTIITISDIPWPSTFRTFISYFFFVNLQFLPWAQLDCVQGFDYITKLVIETLVPIAIIVAIFLFVFVPVMIKVSLDFRDSNEQRERLKINQMRFIRFIFFTLFLIYPSVSTSVIGYFNCRNVEGKNYLIADFSMECGSPVWQKWLPYLVIMLIVYPIGIPILTFFVLFRFRHKLRDFYSILALGFMYEAYQLRYWWFEQIDMIYKLLMTAVLVQINPAIRLQIGLLFVGVYVALVLIIQPFLRSYDDWFHLLAQSLIGLLLLAAHTAQSQGQYDYPMDIIISIFLIIVTVLLVVFLVLSIVRTIKNKYQKHVISKLQDIETRATAAAVLEDQTSSSPATPRLMYRNHSDISLASLGDSHDGKEGSGDGGSRREGPHSPSYPQSSEEMEMTTTTPPTASEINLGREERE